MPWSTTVPARAFPFLYLLLSAGKNLQHTVETNYYPDYPDSPGVMSLLHDDEGDGRIVPLLQLCAGGPDGHQLLSQDSQELEKE